MSNIDFDDGAGYIEIQCIKIILLFIFFAKLKVFVIDAKEFIPVEMIVGFLNLATCSMSGKLLHSPEPIFIALTDIFFNKSAACIEKGVLKKIIFFFFTILF